MKSALTGQTGTNKMREILVTGGAGFLGSCFVRSWYETHPEDKIVVLDNLTYAGRLQNIPEDIHRDEKRFEFCMGSVCSTELVNSLVARADMVVHFAAETHVTRSILDSRIFFETDVLGTHTLANAIYKNNGRIQRFVHISTSEVYGSACYIPMDEDHPLNPCSPYASAKCAADRLVYSFIQTYDIPGVILRPFNQYGPRQHLEKMVPRFITSALKNEPLTVHGDGGARRDWMFVEDTCRWIQAVLEAPLEKVKGRVFNLGKGEAWSVKEMAEKILAITGRPDSLITFIGERLGQVEHHVSSTARIRELFNLDHMGCSIDEGLERTVHWYKDNEPWWQPIKWMKQVKVKTKSGNEELH